MKLFVLLFLLSSGLFAQTASDSANTVETWFPSLEWKKFKERTKINYFSETLGPSIKKWDDNEVNSEGDRQKDPVRTFHSFNIQYRLVNKLWFFMSPRFVSVIGDRNELGPNDDDNVFQLDDSQIGIYYEYYRSPNLTYGQRLTHRQPFSKYSQNSGIDSQIEWTHTLTWQPATGWRVIHWNNYRYYKYEASSTNERYRINFSTLLNYDFNDRWRTQLMHEFDLQHRNPSTGAKERDWNFFKRYENNLALGVGYSPIKEISFIPFIKSLDLHNIRNENTAVGLWVLGKIL